MNRLNLELCPNGVANNPNESTEPITRRPIAFLPFLVNSRATHTTTKKANTPSTGSRKIETQSARVSTGKNSWLTVADNSCERNCSNSCSKDTDFGFNIEVICVTIGKMDGIGNSTRAPKRGFRRWEKAGIRLQSSGELYDAAFGLYRKSGLELLRLIFVPATVTFGLLAMATKFVLPNLFTTSHPESIWQQAGEVAMLVAVALLCVAPVVLVSYSYMTAAASLFVADIHLERRPNLNAIHRAVWSRLIPLTVVNLLVLLRVLFVPLIAFGLLLLSALLDQKTGSRDSVVPFVALFGVLGIVAGFLTVPLAFSWNSISPVVVIQEGVSAKVATRRAKQLLAPVGPTGRGTAAGLLVVTVFLQILLWLAFGIPADLLRDFLIAQGVDSGNMFLRTLYEVLNIFGAYASFVLVHPILIAGITLIYFDRRVLVDGFDIELLAQDIWKNDRAVTFDI